VAWTSTSDSTKKENIISADGEAVLRKINRFRLGSWNFKGQDASRFRHYGPMAQDFFSAFGHDGIGTIGTDTTICASDLSGINMIAIKALEKRSSEMADRIDALEKENDSLRELAADNQKLKTQMAELKSILESLKVDFTEVPPNPVEQQKHQGG